MTEMNAITQSSGEITRDLSSSVQPISKCIEVTSRNLWFLERSIPLFGMLDFFPEESIMQPEFKRAQPPIEKPKLLTIETDQGWSFSTDITSDSKIFRNKSRNRGTGRWIAQADPKPGDRIVIEKIGDYRYLLKLERK